MLEILKTLGLSEEQQSQILEAYNKDINILAGEKKTLADQLAQKEEAVNAQLEKLKQYDVLESDLIKTQAEYESFKQKFDEVEQSHIAKLNDTIIQKEIEKSLIQNNVKYADLLIQKFDKSAIKVKDGVVTGLDKQLENLKANYSDFFNTNSKVTGITPVQQTQSPQFMDISTMTQEEIAKNWDKIRESQRRL